MATVPSGATARGFGLESVPSDLLHLCRSLEPPLGLALEGDSSNRRDLSTVSQELLLAAATGGRADCIYAFCRLNAEAVRAVVITEICNRALPISVDPAVAEVLAEIADAARFVAPTRVPELYSSIPSVAATVVANVVGEALGFVPTRVKPGSRSSIAVALADRLDVPSAVLGSLTSLIDGPTQRIVAAQALMQLSQHDRSLLVSTPGHAGSSSPGSRTVASLLSHEAARRRLVDEYDRIARWLRRALEQDSGAGEFGEETA